MVYLDGEWLLKSFSIFYIDMIVIEHSNLQLAGIYKNYKIECCFSLSIFGE